MTTADFEKLQKQIQDKKDERTRKTGQLDQLMARLKDEFECDTVDAAKDKLDGLTKQLEELDGSITDKQKYIEETYADLIA